MDEPKNESIETGKSARKRVLSLFKLYHPDTSDTPFTQCVSRMLSSVLSKMNDRPNTPFTQFRWDRMEEKMVTDGIEFTKPDTAPYSWQPATPAELVQTLEQYAKGIYPEPRTQQAGDSGGDRKSHMFEYDDTFTKTDGDREKTPPSPEELADVLFYANTLSEMYNINFKVQRIMYEYDWFVRNARVALQSLNKFLKEQTPSERSAYAGVTVELTGFMSHIKVAFLPDAVRSALVSPGTEGAIWESTFEFSINPASVLWQQNELAGDGSSGGVLGRVFRDTREQIGYESRLTGDDHDVAEVQDWLLQTYGFKGIEVSEAIEERHKDPDIRKKGLAMLSFVARALKEAQYDVVEEGTPPNETRVRKEVFTQQDVIDVMKDGYISLAMEDDRRGESAYARQTKEDGVCVYAHEKLDSLWLVGNIQGLIRKKKEATESAPPAIGEAKALPDKGSGEE